MKKFLLIPLFILVFSAAWAQPCLADSPDPRLAQITSVYIGDMGKSDYAERFRLVLEDELAKKGFAVVADETKSDAAISGVFTMTGDEEEVARASLRLRLPSGERIWGGEFRPSFSLRGSSDMSKRVAMTVAYRLQDDKRKAAKK